MDCSRSQRLDDICVRMAEHFGLAWVREPNPGGDPSFDWIGHFERKDGARSASICLYDLAFTDETKTAIGAEVSKLIEPNGEKE